MAVASQDRRPVTVEWCLCRTDSVGGHLRIVDKVDAPSIAAATSLFRRGLYRGYPSSWVVVATAALREVRRTAR